VKVTSVVLKKHRWKLHPQPSSMAKVRRALDNIDLRGKVVLDPFCGTGTLLIVAREKGARVIGSDIEDWSEYLRLGSEGIEFHWGIDVLDAIKKIEHDILLTDPPNPTTIVGGRLPSAYRDTRVKGAQLLKMFNFSERNLMGKRYKTIKVVIKLVKYELDNGRTIVINAFRPYRKYLFPIFQMRQLHDTYYIVEG